MSIFSSPTPPTRLSYRFLVVLLLSSLGIMLPTPSSAFFLESTLPAQGRTTLDYLDSIKNNRFQSTDTFRLSGEHRYELYFRDQSTDEEQDHFYKHSQYGMRTPVGDTDLNFLASDVETIHHTLYANDEDSVRLNLESNYRNIGLNWDQKYFSIGTNIQDNKSVSNSTQYNPWGKIEIPGYLQAWGIRNDRYGQLDSKATLDNEELTIGDDFRMYENLYGGQVQSRYYLPELTYRFQEKDITEYNSTTPVGENHVQSVDAESEFQSWKVRFPYEIGVVPIYRKMDYDDLLRMNMTTVGGDRIFTAFQRSDWERTDYRLAFPLTESSKLVPGYFTRNSQGIGSGIFNPNNFDSFFDNLYPVKGSSANAFYEFESELEGYSLTYKNKSQHWQFRIDTEYYDYDRFLLDFSSGVSVFGFRLFQNQETVDYESLKIANLRFTGDYRWSDRVKLNFLLRQLVPVEIEEKEDDESGVSDGVGGGGDGGDDDFLDTWGGFRTGLTVSVKF